MVIVKPGDSVSQNKDDVVIYQLKFEDWSADLERPDDTNARISTRTIAGSSEMLFVKVLPYQPGSHLQAVRIAGGGTKKGEYEVVRIVKSKDEARRKSFTVRIDP